MKLNLDQDHEGDQEQQEAMQNLNLELMETLNMLDEIHFNNLGVEMPGDPFHNLYNIDPFPYRSCYHGTRYQHPLPAPHSTPSSTPPPPSYCYGGHHHNASSMPSSTPPPSSLVDHFRALCLQSDPTPTLNPAPYLYPYPLPRQPITRRVPESPNLTPALIPGPARPALHNCEDSFILEALEGRRARRHIYNNNRPFIYHFAKDQDGCRLLQKKIDEGRRHEIDEIFNGVIAHVADLMMNPFANYLVQKLLDVCTEEQRLRIVLNLTRDPWEIIRVSLNTHGTRVVQKLIETLKTPQQIRLIVLALKLGFLHLIRDLNGNHVIQCCLKSFSTDDNKFIFYAAAQYCVQIATHRHGCCVLQRCITYSTGEYRARLVEEIAAHGLLLAQDAYGNYVVQFIIELKNPSIMATLASQFEGNYVHLATKKFSSNVVEKCLKHFVDINRQTNIVLELLQFGRFEMLLQDPFANYVIQTALDHTQGCVHAALVDAILPHEALRTIPYCKRVFIKARMKK